jgi:hypothetical protein
LPTWLLWVGSLVIAGHFFAILILVLAAPSGRWPDPMVGERMAPPPPFAQKVNEITQNYYLKHLKLVHNYHFNSNRPVVPGVKFEVKLYDEQGTEVKTLTFPDPRANSWEKHRQTLMARHLAEDRTLVLPEGELLRTPDGSYPPQAYWQPDRIQRDQIRLTSKPLDQVPRTVLGEMPTMRPSWWSMVLSRSYVRYLRHKHGAASGTLVRITRDPLPSGGAEPIQDWKAIFGGDAK